ncbi:MAG: DUF1016 family protein [Bacteroidales bacterium]|nr:DUF1016 family protein [Bacteroidales bacterium]
MKGSNSIVSDTIRNEFLEVYGIIQAHRNKIIAVVDNESLLMIWEVCGYVSAKLKCSSWGDGVVRRWAEFIHTQDPTSRGWSYRTIYKMVQLYETYSNDSFRNLLKQTKMIRSDKIVPIETAQITDSKSNDYEAYKFVPLSTAQMPNVFLATGWSNHQIILSRCKTDNERLFYMLYAGHEHLKNKELERAIKTNAMTSLLGSANVQSNVMKTEYPNSKVMFKDTAYLDFLGLPVKYKESKLRKDIVTHMKDFILEVGKDFLFIDQEHKVAVGGKTFKIDLLFYHRQLQCMVAFELKTTEFKPSYLGQLEFYLEALDQEERRTNENPTIGILFCKESDMDVVRFALNRSMSPLMIMQYKEQLKIGSVIQRSLVEFCEYLTQCEK